MKHRVIAAFIFMFVIVAAQLNAQPVAVNEPVIVPVIRKEPEVTAQANFNVGSAFVGDNVAYTLTFRWVDDGTTYRITPPHIDPLELKVVNVATSTESSEDNDVRYKVRSYVYELKAVAEGKAMIEALTVSYYADGSPNPYFVSLPAMSLEITAVKQPLMQDKRLMASLAGGAILVIGVIAIIVIKRRKSKKPVQISPQEKIASDLKDAQALLERGEFNKVVVQLDAVARFFLAEVVRITTGAHVSSEALGNEELFRALDEKHRAAIVRVLKRSEEARYSGIQYERHEVRMLLDDLQSAIGSAVK